MKKSSIKKSIVHVIPSDAKENATNVAGSSTQRAEVAQALSQFLASTYVLYQKSLYYHWNVKGSNFIGLHTLFEKHYEELHNAGDTIAERIRAIGHSAPGTLTEFIAASSIAEDKKLPSSSREMVANLLTAHEICSKEAAEVLHIAERAHDEVTVDLMISRMAFHDKAAWMLRATEA